jgi:hypothetical protein
MFSQTGAVVNIQAEQVKLTEQATRIKYETLRQQQCQSTYDRERILPFLGILRLPSVMKEYENLFAVRGAATHAFSSLSSHFTLCGRRGCAAKKIFSRISLYGTVR